MAFVVRLKTSGVFLPGNFVTFAIALDRIQKLGYKEGEYKILSEDDPEVIIAMQEVCKKQE